LDYLVILVGVADPGFGAFLTPGMGKNQDISYSLETFFWVKILKFFDADPGWKN
jgi:hypothetical protein